VLGAAQGGFGGTHAGLQPGERGVRGFDLVLVLGFGFCDPGLPRRARGWGRLGAGGSRQFGRASLASGGRFGLRSLKAGLGLGCGVVCMAERATRLLDFPRGLGACGQSGGQCLSLGGALRLRAGQCQVRRRGHIAVSDESDPERPEAVPPLPDGLHQDARQDYAWDGRPDDARQCGVTTTTSGPARPSRTTDGDRSGQRTDRLAVSRRRQRSLLIATNTSTEYWQKGASLIHIDPAGKADLTLPPNSRVYMIAGTQHGGAAGLPTTPGACANPHNPAPALRALIVALEDWVVKGIPPPPSRVPSIAQRTAVPASAVAMPAIKGVALPPGDNPITEPVDWVNPPEADAPGPDGRPVFRYETRVPAVDADGNETSGIRLPPIAVPLATYTGWNVYRAQPTELCDRSGTYAPPAMRTRMTKRLEAKHKLDRRMGQNIWGRPKSPVNRREYGPGQHGQRRKGKLSDFGVQLRAKQKLKGYYANISEKQFRGIYAEAIRMKGDSGQHLIGLF
jgi:hypothetical protein